jgi:hypothetical protein
VDASTVFAGGLTGLADLADLRPVQVHGLPGPGGQLLATRVELLSVAGAPIVSGVVESLDPVARTFRIGNQAVRYDTAALDGFSRSTTLANGQLVRVRATVPAPILQAVSVELWSEPPVVEATPLSLGGVVSDFRGLGR